MLGVKTKNAFYHSFTARVSHITSTSCKLYQSQIVINNIVKCERLRSTKFGDEWPLGFATTFHYFPITLQQKANGPSEHVHTLPSSLSLSMASMRACILLAPTWATVLLGAHNTFPLPTLVPCARHWRALACSLRIYFSHACARPR